MNKNILRIAGLVVAFFLLNIAYLTYLQVFKADELLNHPRNRRLQAIEEQVNRGRILDSKGRVLAETITENGYKKRSYPYGDVFSHLTGYVSKRYGRAGLEAGFNGVLLGFNKDFAGNDFWSLKKFGRLDRGSDIVLSIDSSVQQLAYRLLGQRRGAVVALEPSTGRVLAMVSKPGFNPENLELQWQNLNRNPESSLLNRATQGLYPPGSTFKV
ncbi:MAG TPA: penicillin-binding transpeptidase domain-containing protein, partial [Desulfobacteria bacterium]|nr:penicillin-binding transpeptidase domain-containing protein [Desulfobacteria bacterium]